VIKRILFIRGSATFNVQCPTSNSSYSRSTTNRFARIGKTASRISETSRLSLMVYPSSHKRVPAAGAKTESLDEALAAFELSGPPRSMESSIRR